MTDFAVLSPEELANRRRALRQQRRIRNLQRVWRLLAISGIASGTLWLTYNPFWLLRSRDQIVVEGNELLSDPAVQSLLPLEYPQSLLEVEPDQLAQFLQTQSPVAHASVDRQLFPPRLEIHIQERYPVAVTIPTKPELLAQTDAKTGPVSQPGLLDRQGHWMAQASFTQVDPKFALPELAVRGFNVKYQTQWPSLYQALQTSPVKISEVDWSIPSNVILHTQLGTVHLGNYDSQLIRQQLFTLAQLQSLQSTESALDIEYIDLRNPGAPSLKVKSVPRHSLGEGPP